MSELYTISITGIVASDVGDPAMSWTDESLPDLVKSLFDRDVKSMLFATHEDGKVSFTTEFQGVLTKSQLDALQGTVKDPDNVIGDALDDANGFYEMFEGYEGVEERVERLHQAMQMIDSGEMLASLARIQRRQEVPPVSRDMMFGVSPEAKEELDKAFAKVRPDLYPERHSQHYLTCPECGEEVERNHKLQKYCNEACRKTRNVRVAREAKEVNLNP